MQEPSSDERIQRVRIGLTGLAFVFLLVLLGTAISRSSDDPAPTSTNMSGLAAGAEPEEPLAELGVAPGQSTTDNAAERGASEGGAAATTTK
ncbi:MAG: hypothetical protein LH465_05215 [Sphingomonas bacterium]|nr:hypothetical protein [Sphingomonas bacterium]